jgi:hypothetical protein
VAGRLFEPSSSPKPANGFALSLTMPAAPVIEHRMKALDFKTLTEAGANLLSEVRLGTVEDGKTADQMVEWARKYGGQNTIHTGGPSIPGSGLIDADMVLEIGTDVVCHINVGHAVLPDNQITCFCENCRSLLEIFHNGNEHANLLTLNAARGLKKLDQVLSPKPIDAPFDGGYAYGGVMAEQLLRPLPIFGQPCQRVKLRRRQIHGHAIMKDGRVTLVGQPQKGCL